MRRLNSSQVRRLSGFGANSSADMYVFQPETDEELLDVFEIARTAGRRVVLRGAGRSYGDAALLAESIAIDTSRMATCKVDTEAGVVAAGPGATIEDLWRTGLPHGMWPPVVSGTMKTTIGGGLAMNIHGKNAFVAGTLGEWVEGIRVATPAGELLWIGREDPEIKVVISSAGLVAAITQVELRMKRVVSGLLDVQPVTCRNWDEQFQAFDSHVGSADYMVSWVDMFSSGSRAGRGLFHAANHVDEAGQGSLSESSQDLPPRVMGLIPKAQVWRILKVLNRRGLMRMLNQMKHVSGALSHKPYRQSLVAFSFLLDYVPGWERAYSPHGFIQYQCFLPMDSARRVFEQIGAMCQAEGFESFLGVMKRHRKDGFALSHGVDGYSLALDFKVEPRTWPRLLALCHKMNDMVLDSGGKFYLAKDSTLRPEDVLRFVPAENLNALKDLKARFDPDFILDSSLNQRLKIV